MISQTPKYNNRAYFWPVLLVITISLTSGSQHLATPDLSFPFLGDKIAHFLIFGLVATSILRTPNFKDLNLQSILIAALITSAYGAFDELRQSLTPNRRVEFADWLADTLGAFVAVTLYAKWQWYRRLLEWSRTTKREGEQDSYERLRN